MRLTVVVQSAAFLDSAGARIRYQRFAQHLGGAAELEITPIEELASRTKFTSDSYVFVKTFGSKALILAAHLKAAGKWVGHDLFDDYFSQVDDARLAYFRGWLHASAPFTDFVVCTTPRMSEVARRYFPRACLGIVPDPFAQFDLDHVMRLLAAKAARMQASRRLDVLWFGIGDNPYFPVGLADLAAQAGELARARRLGWDVSLTVMTNNRALSADGLALMRSLPVPHRLATWSEAAEASALEEADIAFLPVSGQSFSRAKSLNRAITSLCAGCQVLSTGFPLYSALDPVIYRSIESLIEDVARGEPRLSAKDAGRLMALLRDVADPGAAAEGFVDTARPAAQRPAPARGPLCVVHGMDSPSENHKLASRFKALSVRSPFHNGVLNYDIRFDARPDGYDIFVEKSLLERLAPGLPLERGKLQRLVQKDYGRLDGAALGLDAGLAPCSAGSSLTAAKLLAYPRVMRALIAACGRLLPGARVVISDNAQLAPIEMVLARTG